MTTPAKLEYEIDSEGDDNTKPRAGKDDMQLVEESTRSATFSPFHKAALQQTCTFLLFSLS